MDVMFPNGSDRFNLPMNYFEIENNLKETQWEKTRTMVDLQREQSLFDLARFNYEKKKQEFVQFLAQSSSFAAQVMTQSYAPHTFMVFCCLPLNDKPIKIIYFFFLCICNYYDKKLRFLCIVQSA